MFNYYKSLDLPKLPDNLIAEVLDSMNNGKNIFYDKKSIWYKQMVGNEKLQEYTKDLFDFNHLATIQVIRAGLPIHIDVGRTEAYNYLIDTGGENVTTAFYKKEDFYITENHRTQFIGKNIQIVEEICIPVSTWHWLDVSMPHTVKNISRQRIAISINKI